MADGKKRAHRIAKGVALTQIGISMAQRATKKRATRATPTPRPARTPTPTAPPIKRAPSGAVMITPEYEAWLAQQKTKRVTPTPTPTARAGRGLTGRWAPYSQPWRPTPLRINRRLLPSISEAMRVLRGLRK